MLWKTIKVLTDTITAPPGYSIDHLKREEVPRLVESLRGWFPEMVAGGERCHLSPEFYYSKAQFAGETEDKRIFPVVIKHNGEIVSLVTVEKDHDDLTITARLGVVDPEHRGAGLGHLGPQFVEQMGRAIGAELAYFFTTLRIPQEQVISERQGFKLVGILPASDRELMGDGTVKRVPEAIFAKILVPESELYVPPPEALTEKTGRFWKFLFG